MSNDILWAPDHHGVKGNKMADEASRETDKNSAVGLDFHFIKTDFFLIKHKMEEKMQMQWEKGRNII